MQAKMTVFREPRLSFSRSSLSIALAAVLSTLLAACASKSAEKPAPLESGPAATIADVAWIAGHWRGEAMNGEFEETWNPPLGNSMQGVFKLVRDGKTVFTEILQITEENGSLALRLKHFDAEMKGWEEKDESVRFPLTKLSLGQAAFGGLRFVQKSGDLMDILVTIKSEDGERVARFAGRRQGL